MVQSKAEVARLAAEANRKTVTKARADLAQAKADAKTARQKKDTAATIATEARKTSQNPGQTPAEAKRSKEDSNTAAKNLEAATERSTVADKKLQEAEETAAVSAKGAEAAMRKANALAVEESKAPPYSQKDIDKVKPTKNELSSAFEGTSRKAELEKLLSMTPSPPRDIARKPERGESPPPHLDAVDAQDAKAATRMVGERGTYLDRSSGTTYQVRKNATTGETLLSDAASGSSVTIKPDGSYTSTVTSKESTKSGGTRETTWTRSSDAKGQSTGLESRKSQTEKQAETGTTTTTSTMTYDTTRSPPRPLSRTEEARMERPPAALASQKGVPQGPATVKTETQFNAQGLPTQQVKTTQVQTPGFRAGEVSAFEAGQGSALQNASKGEDHYRTNNAPTSLKPGESSLTITDEIRFNAKGEPAASTQKTESVTTQALKSDKNGNGVQVVRSQQEVTRGPASAEATDALPAISSKTPGVVNQRTTVTGYDPDGSRFGEGHASRTQTVSQSSGTVDANGQRRMRHQPTEVKSLHEASDNRWRFDHVGFDVGADGKVVPGQEPRQLDKERQLPWYEDATEFATDELKALADTADDVADAAFDFATAPLEEALTDEIKKLNSAGDSVSLSGNLDVKMGLKGGISGDAAIERTEDGKYQLSAEVTADVGVGVLGSASVGAGGRMEWKLDTPEEAAKAAFILAKGPSAMIPGSEDAKFLKDHLSAVEVNVNGEVEGGVNFKVGSGNVDLSASLGATGGLRVEFDKGKPTHLVKTVEFEGSGAAGVATGLKGKADLNVGGEVSGSVSIETKTPLDASKLDGTDVLSFLTGAKSDALAGPSETSITVEGSVDKGNEGHYFTAEVAGLSDKDVQSVTDKLKAGKFENAFDDLKKEAKVTQGTFKDREAGLGAKLVVVDFELNARHRDVTAEGGGGGNGSTTVSLGSGKRRGDSDGASGGHGATGGTNRSTGNEATGGAGPSSKSPGKTSAERNGQPASTNRTEPLARSPGDTIPNREPPTQYRVNPATGQFMPVPPLDGGPSHPGASKKPGTPGGGAEIGPSSKEGQDEKSPTSGHRPVPVVRNPELPGRTTHVRYDDGKVHIEAGPAATKEDIQAHMETARILLRYEGAVGKVRQLIDKVKQAITGMPGYGTQGFESRLEVRKLSSILKDLEATQAQLAQGIQGATNSATPATALQRAELERRIASVESQLGEHTAQVDSLARGNGIVAERDDRTPPRMGDPAVQQAVDTAWNNLTRPEDRRQLSTVLESEAFSQLEPREQERLLQLVGGTNPQLSQPIRQELFRNVDNVFRSAEVEPEDQANYLRNYLPDMRQQVPGAPDHVPTTETPYDARRRDVAVENLHEVFEPKPGFPTQYEVVVDGKSVRVTMWPPPEPLPEGRRQLDVESVANAIAALPAWARESLKKVHIKGTAHKLDTTNPDQNRKAFMAADDKGVVTIHPIWGLPEDPKQLQNHIDGTLVHELAHTVSKQAWPKTSDWDAWTQAMETDGVSPSRYPQRKLKSEGLEKAMQEDFSEAVKLYDQVRGTPYEAELRAMMPKRFELLDRFFKDRQW
ncbi:hypothetical protein [Myxococcus sp. AS-1-15]|uniref:hypothetical protein n=1 Tax=Myxococcus sp. AS-1-15 TaxID=2874600 RepID=UPI001CBE2410|nr:hypothetical protein [Myxococcus sp. AS-1-15]MBZ4401958.1 hypothetical protein [Myxococcus sp. AS-1-15]